MKAETTHGGLDTNGQATQLLFIDDEEQVLSYLRKNLSSLGYDVVTSTGWGEAKRLFKDPDVHPELIFIEPLLQANNGSRSLREIFAEAAHIPVIILSTSRDPRSIVQVIQAGARDYVFKPVQLRQLCETISTTLDSRVNPEITHSKTTSGEVELVFCAPEMERICNTVHQIAATRVPVLCTSSAKVGPSGPQVKRQFEPMLIGLV